ncbi:MAG: hypothetical protein NTV34_08705 [Proteobacteria bacterium]|nr:hypothetical protein [Pseudomonadota bacterium]
MTKQNFSSKCCFKCLLDYYLPLSILVATTALPTSPGSAAEAQKPPVREATSGRSIGLVFASDGQPTQASIDFYRSVYKALAHSTTWEALPLEQTRMTLSLSPDSPHLGGIPTIDRESFRKSLPRRSRHGKITPGSPVRDLQRFLDNTRTAAIIIADCARKDKFLLKACALYYYDRVLSRVSASTVKNFISGANDATAWSNPMLKNLEEGIAAAQREKDQTVIEELVARKEDDEGASDKFGLIGLYGKGDRTGVSLGAGRSWKQTISGAGVQLGFLSSNVGAYAELGQLTWSGSSEDVTRAIRTHYGLGMLFRANALDALLWFFEIGGGKEKSTIDGDGSGGSLAVDGSYIHVSPGIGVELSDFFTLNMGVGWRWFFESSHNGTGSLKDATLDDSHGPSLMLRAMVLI